MRRRDFITLLSSTAVAGPLAARAQSSGTLRIGMVAAQPRLSSPYTAFLQRLAELGYQQGRNLDFEFIQAAKPEDYARGDGELVTRGVDILMAAGPEIALKSALAATNTLPIVMLAIDYDPISLGYVTSLARPTGNVTGIFLEQIELTTKRLQVVKDAFPELRAATVFWDWISADQWRAAQSAAPMLGLQLFGSELGEQPTITKKPWHRHPLIIAVGCS
jgi:putative ABC transport system substrate-binding protein